MALFQKTYYNLNKSNSKCILLALVKNEDKFTPTLFIYGDKSGVRLSLRQYLELYNSNDDLFAFLDKRVKSAFLNLSNEEDGKVWISGLQTQSTMLMIRQFEKNYNNVVCIAKETFEKLLTLRPIIQRTLIRMEQSHSDIAETFQHHKAGEKNFLDKINMFGFDVYNFAWELELFENGVTEVEFNNNN